jgi:signal transduction histidine kinase
VARDLHDSTGETLTALKMALATLQNKVSDDRSKSSALSDIAEIADRELQEIRTTSYLLLRNARTVPFKPSGRGCGFGRNE